MVFLLCRACSMQAAHCCLLLAHEPSQARSLRPPWSGVSASIQRTTPVTCVLRRWLGPGPGVQATEQSRISRFGDLATGSKHQTR
jgi:hypothetical protein